MTDRRVVRYDPVLAGLARWLPSLRGVERRSRVVRDLADVASVALDGRRVTVRCGDVEFAVRSPREVEARHLAASVRRAGAERRAALEAAERVGRVSVTGARARARPGARCPHCHDDLRPAEARACPACATPHHEDCLAVHGRCAVSGCRGRPAAAPVRERA